MGFILKWIQSLSVPVDETTGAIRVKADLDVTPDIDIGDVHLLDTADAKINPATKESVDAVTAALGTPAQAGEIAAAIPDLATSAKQDEVIAGVASGLPVAFQTDAEGADAYTTVVTVPDRVCHYALIQLDAGHDAVVSLDGGATGHLFIKANSQEVLSGLTIGSGAAVQGRNAAAGSNYTNLRITVW